MRRRRLHRHVQQDREELVRAVSAGAAEPVAFTSRYDSWQYFGDVDPLPQTLRTLSTTVDLRVPLTFSVEDCADIAEIIAEEAQRFAA